MVVPNRQLLSGTVEVDETFVGGMTRGTASRGTDKVRVMITAESLGRNRIGRIRLETTPDGKLQLVTFAQRVVEPGSLIETDGAIGPHPLKTFVIPDDFS